MVQNSVCPVLMYHDILKLLFQYSVLTRCDILKIWFKIQSSSNVLGYYTIIDFNEVDIRIYLPEKVIIH